MDICLLDSRKIIHYQDDIHELLKMCFESTYEYSISEDIVNEKYLGLINYINADKAYVFGAIDNNHLLGFLWGYPVDTLSETVFHVAYIAIKASERRSGIGQKLLYESEKKCSKLGLKHIELIVGAKNSSALSFYEHCGYKPDRLYMRKEVR